MLTVLLTVAGNKGCVSSSGNGPGDSGGLSGSGEQSCRNVGGHGEVRK